MLDRRIKENELRATEYRIEKLKAGMGFFTRNKWKVIIAGALITFFGPFYAMPSSKSKPAVHGMAIGDVDHLQFMVILAVLYSLAVVIGHFTWTSQDKRKLNRLETKRDQIKIKLEMFYRDQAWEKPGIKLFLVSW